MTRELQVAETVDEVITALGGTAPTVALTDRSPQALTNWKAARKIPSNFYLRMQSALRKRGWTAPASLWGIDEPAEAAQ